MKKKQKKKRMPYFKCMFNVGCGVVRGLAGVWGPVPSVQEIPAPPAAAAARSPGPPASDGAETAPSDAAPPAKQAHVTTALLTTLMLLFAAIVVSLAVTPLV